MQFVRDTILLVDLPGPTNIGYTVLDELDLLVAGFYIVGKSTEYHRLGHFDARTDDCAIETY